MINRTILMGRLTRDPEVSYSQRDNMCIARFSLAVDRRGKDNGADFINCVCFGKTAEFMEKYVVKGTKLVVEGHIQTGSYTNKDGQKVYTTDVIVDNCDFAESKKSGNEQPTSTATDDQGFMNIPDQIDEELPFA